MQKAEVSGPAAAFLLAGVLGSFTTFSTFSFETVDLLQSGRILMALAYVLTSNFGGVLLAWMSFASVRSMLSV